MMTAKTQYTTSLNMATASSRQTTGSYARKTAVASSRQTAYPHFRLLTASDYLKTAEADTLPTADAAGPIFQNFILKAILAVILLAFAPAAQASLQDTVRIGFEQFVEMAQQYSADLDADRKQVELAENRVSQARSNRYLPELSLTTAHGMVPGVTSQREDLAPGQYYLDPDLKNDWEDWGIFTRADISGVQPIYTWGGISNVINAARKGAEAARHEFDSEKESFELRLFELYQSALLVRELERLMEEARSQLEEAEKELERLREEGDEDLEEKDVFEFYIFKEEFQAHITEMEQTKTFVRNTWNMVLASDRNTVYMPAERFLDPVPVQVRDLSFYENHAVDNRAELRGLDAAQESARYGVDAARSQYYPNLILGLSAGLGYTPNRPRQVNPFIRNNSNYLSTRIGFGFQQNLNFLQIHNQVQRSEIQLRQLRDYRDAAEDGILLELGEHYQQARVTEARWESKQNALKLSNEWLRTEQIDRDLGFGDINNLVDAVKKKMELELEVTELTFDRNMKLAQLHRSAGIPLHELFPDNTD